MELRKITFIISILFFVVCFSCQNNPTEDTKPIQQNVENEKIAVNREIVRRETADIELIAKRYDWNLSRTESGLYYQIAHATNGKQAQPKDLVRIKGTIFLSDGKEIYNSEIDGIKEFTVDRSEDPVGLHELTKTMREGEKVNGIIPSYLAHGISGDGELIPPIALLICKIELIKIN